MERRPYPGRLFRFGTTDHTDHADVLNPRPGWHE